MNYKFDKLVARAREEEISDIDVSSQVMSRIRGENIARFKSPVKSMGYMALISTIAASIIIIFTIYSYEKNYDPLYQSLYHEISWVETDRGL